MSVISMQELVKNDGRGENPAHVAVNGAVYDITESQFWKYGEHMGEHYAGCDLTEALKRAPHGIEMLERYQRVGELEPEAADISKNDQPIPRWASIMLSLRSHPMFVHFPQAFFISAPIFLTLFYAVKYQDFERTAFFLIVAGFLTAIPAAISGFVHWRYKFICQTEMAFKLKIILSPLLIVLAAVTVGLHIGKGKISPDDLGTGLLILYWIHLFIAIALGKAGGNIVFGRKQ